MFTAPTHLVAGATVGVKRSVASISPVPEATIQEGPFQLESKEVLPLAKNEKLFSPFTLASTAKAACQTHIAQHAIAPASSVVTCNATSFDLSRIEHSIEDGPDNASVFVCKESIALSVHHHPWLKDTADESFANPTTKEDWNRGLNSLSNTAANHQVKAMDAICAVAQFTLPFKMLKEIKDSHILPIIDPDTGSVALHFQLWHADQSGRNAASIAKLHRLVKKKQLCFDATRSYCTFATTNLPFLTPPLTQLRRPQ